jgi:hypothetical protein
MIRKYLISITIISSLASMNLISLLAQMPAAISITPANATGRDELTITYTPSKGCTPSGKGSLVGSDVMKMHSAAFLYDNIANWKKAWGAYGIDYNSVPKDTVHLTAGLTKTSDTTWAITLVPADYYGVPEGKVIIGLTIVFNGGSWDKEGKDFKLDACSDFYVPLTYTAPSAIKVSHSISSSSVVVRNVSSENTLLVESLNGIKEISVMDILGKEIIKTYGSNKNNMKLNIYGLRQGIYIVAVTEKNGRVVSAKFIKE